MGHTTRLTCTLYTGCSAGREQLYGPSMNSSAVYSWEQGYTDVQWKSYTAGEDVGSLRGFLQVRRAKLHLASSVRKVAPHNCRRKLPLSVLIVSSKDCKGMLLTKYCRQSSSLTRMPWAELGAG